MSDLFRQSTPVSGRYSRKLFFYLAFGILFYSGVNSAVETLNNHTATTLVDVTAVRDQTADKTESNFARRPLASNAHIHSPHALDPATDRIERPRS